MICSPDAQEGETKKPAAGGAGIHGMESRKQIIMMNTEVVVDCQEASEQRVVASFVAKFTTDNGKDGR